MKVNNEKFPISNEALESKPIKEGINETPFNLWSASSPLKILWLFSFQMHQNKQRGH